MKYSPDNPSISEYQPAEWLKGQEDVKRIGWAISGFAALGLAISGWAAWARLKGRLGDRSFPARTMAGPGVIGLLFFAAGAGFQGVILWRSLLGSGFVLSVNHGPPHVASPEEIFFFSMFLVPFWGIGLLLMSGRIRTKHPH